MIQTGYLVLKGPLLSLSLSADLIFSPRCLALISVPPDARTKSTKHCMSFTAEQDCSSHVQNFGSRGFMPVYPRPKMSQWPWATLMSMHALSRMDFALKQANNGWSNYLTRDQKGLLQTSRFAGWRTSIVARPGIPICQKVRLTPKVWSVCQESLCTAGDGGICIVFLMWQKYSPSVLK